MSDREHTDGPADELGLTDDDLARALATSVERGGRLVQRRQRRRAALSAVGAVALLAGGFGVISSLSDDTAAVDVTPSGKGAGAATSSSPSTTVTTDTLPAGYVVGVSSLGVHAVVYLGPQDGGSFAAGSDGVVLGNAITSSRQTPVVSATVIDETRMRVEFECVRNASDRLEAVRYFLRDGVVHLDAEISGGRPGRECSGGVGVRFDLVFAEGGLPANATTVVERVD